MTKNFIKEKSNCFYSDLSDAEKIKVINYIMKLTTLDDSDKLSVVTQFINNWINIEVISYK